MIAMGNVHAALIPFGMNGRLPIWFQAAALFALVFVLLATFCWVASVDESLQQGHSRRRIESDTYGLVYFLMSLPIAWLGGRFCCRFRLARTRKSLLDNACYGIGVLLTLIVLTFIIAGFLAPVQKVREGGGVYAAVDVRDGH
jgi:hypothetical protein